MRNIIIILSAVLLLSSCSRNTCPEVSLVRKDSTVIRDSVRLRDSVITVPGQQIGFSDLLDWLIPDGDTVIRVPRKSNADSAELIYNRTVQAGSMTAAVSIDRKGNLNVLCKEDSLLFRIQYLEHYISFMQSTSETKTVQVPGPLVKEWYIPKWVWYYIGATLLYFVWQYWSPISKAFGFIFSLVKKLISK